VNSEPKTENDPAAEADLEEGCPDGSATASEQATAFESVTASQTETASVQAGEAQLDAPADDREAPGSEEGPVTETEAQPVGGVRPRAEGSRLKAILEALIFVADQPISLDRMAAVLTDCSKKTLKETLAELEEEYEQRGGSLQIVEVANGYQFRTRAEFAPWIGKLRQQRFARLSRAALETLAIVAYRQPTTRAEVESIRGVDTGAVLGTLLERRLLRILGRKEVPGRPIIYGTTPEFLELFGLKSLKDLPTLREIKDMVDEARKAPDGEATEEEDEAAASGARSSPEFAGEEEAESEIESESQLEEEGEGEGEGPREEDEISPRELDEILKTTKTRLELYEADLQGDLQEDPEADLHEGQEAGRTGAAEETDDRKNPGQGDNPEEG
jgi:segregation and condensation protein B